MTAHPAAGVRRAGAARQTRRTGARLARREASLGEGAGAAAAGLRRVSSHQNRGSKTSTCSFPRRTSGRNGLPNSGRVGTFLLVALSKGKLLLLGLTKISTLASMLAFFAVYWSLFGWRFALGFVMSIYIHEMGHVMALRKYNIAASAPMFIPFFGAFVRMKQYPGNVGEDARVGWPVPSGDWARRLRRGWRPITTGLPIWYAIAHTAAWLNLFNLLPDLAVGWRPRFSRAHAETARHCGWRGGGDVGPHSPNDSAPDRAGRGLPPLQPRLPGRGRQRGADAVYRV